MEADMSLSKIPLVTLIHTFIGTESSLSSCTKLAIEKPSSTSIIIESN